MQASGELVTVNTGSDNTVSEMGADAVTQVRDDKLLTLGPTRIRYCAPSAGVMLFIGKLLAVVPGVPIFTQVFPLSVLFCH